jgi:hypothetical protein
VLITPATLAIAGHFSPKGTFMDSKKMSTLILSAVAATIMGCATIPQAHAATHLNQAESTQRGQEKDSRWEKLGERTVDEKNDKDTIQVGRDDGRFKAIQLKVEGSSMVLADVVVTFGDGSKFEPKTRIVFDKNSSTRVIDLPGDRRVIKRVDFHYGNLPGGGRARVELWAR